MELLILCAGATDKSWTGAKSDRPLRTKGKRQAQKIGAWMGQKGLCPDIVLVASGSRARVTAEKALKAAGWTARNIHQSTKPSVGTLPAPSDDRRVLLVAPSGDIRSLVGRLGLDLELSPGVLLQLSYNPGQTSLIIRVDPKNLPNQFPYPAPDGPERRERPAYYYTQSAVVPYRKTDQGTQILIVGSSSGRHWVVPKGIVEPGLSPVASAMAEAREEAGVQGRIRKTPLGTISCEKWGATCQITVFAMEVTHILPEHKWEESHRKRKWVSPADAASLLHQVAFQAMVWEIEGNR